MKRLLAAAVILAFVCPVSSVVAADPSGMWNWTTTCDDHVFECSIKLKFDAETKRLTGAYFGGQIDEQSPIRDASFQGNTISFSLPREFNGQKNARYSGTLKGDTIKGKLRFERDGKAESTEWVAKRQK